MRKSRLGSPGWTQSPAPEDPRQDRAESLSQQRTRKAAQIKKSMGNMNSIPYQQHPSVVTTHDLFVRQAFSENVPAESGLKDEVQDAEQIAQPLQKRPSDMQVNNNIYISPFDDERNKELRSKKQSDKIPQALLKRPSPTITDLQRRQESQQTVVGNDVSDEVFTLKRQGVISPNFRTIVSPQ